MIDIRQTREYANYLSKIGWQVERSAEISYFVKKLPIFSSIIKIQRPEEIRISKIREIAKKYRAVRIIIEPKTQLDANYLTSLGYKNSSSPYLPTSTLQIDLTQSLSQIKRGLKKDARGAIRNTQKLAVGKEDKIEIFRKAWKNAVGFKRYVPPLSHLIALKKSFPKGCLFLLDGGFGSGAIFLLADDICYYWQAFTNKAGREKLSQYKIVWEAIIWAKKLGARIFDFEGIYDERFPNKSWLGFTHFKKSFGGYEVTYPGTFVKWFL